MFGGVFPRPHPEPDGCSDCLYIFNPEMAIWYQPIVNGDKPAPRSGLVGYEKTFHDEV